MRIFRRLLDHRWFLFNSSMVDEWQLWMILGPFDCRGRSTSSGRDELWFWLLLSWNLIGILTFCLLLLLHKRRLLHQGSRLKAACWVTRWVMWAERLILSVMRSDRADSNFIGGAAQIPLSEIDSSHYMTGRWWTPESISVFIRCRVTLDLKLPLSHLWSLFQSSPRCHNLLTRDDLLQCLLGNSHCFSNLHVQLVTSGTHASVVSYLWSYHESLVLRVASSWGLLFQDRRLYHESGIVKPYRPLQLWCVTTSIWILIWNIRYVCYCWTRDTKGSFKLRRRSGLIFPCNQLVSRFPTAVQRVTSGSRHTVLFSVCGVGIGEVVIKLSWFLSADTVLLFL